MSLLPENNYQNILTSLKEKIRNARYYTALKVNLDLLNIYWEIGNTILLQQKLQGWGSKVVARLAKDLKMEFPDFRGLSERNLVYMQTFAASYPYFPFTQAPLAQTANDTNTIPQVPLAELETVDKQVNTFAQANLAQISWYHHITLLDKVKEKEERLFYIKKTIENGWSRNVLVLQIENNLFARQGNAITNFPATLPPYDSDLAIETLKSAYVFDFIAFSEEIKERDIERALIQHLKKFMLELGRGFSYVGNQKNIHVDGDDFFLDLLFFNYNLNCFVIIELKVGDFKPEFAGKLNFYVNTVNGQLTAHHHKPAIGVLLCKTPNKTVVEYSLKGIDSPIGVADYELAKALPKELKGGMPSIAELEAEIEKEYEELKTPSQKRFDLLKEKLAGLKGNEIKQTATTEILFGIFDNSLLPLYTALITRMQDFNHMFVSYNYQWQAQNSSINSIDQLAQHWKDEAFLKSNRDFYFNYQLHGFIKAGTEAFNISFQLNYRIDTYWYGFTLVNYNEQRPFIKKLYGEQLTPQEIKEIVELIFNEMISDIETNIEIIKQ